MTVVDARSWKSVTGGKPSGKIRHYSTFDFSEMHIITESETENHQLLNENRSFLVRKYKSYLKRMAICEKIALTFFLNLLFWAKRPGA
ncbi:MAG: hypothetical protein CSA61_02150 [Neptuniibacter caesariensis]|uniref:Uncharacterized protein n=1 Tax=Neptuniibacter caesariensis TaxID=207954 RepID=A0A2G6JAJ1_NEPCE|nr:MAG: hypothetical protein CSA61_02150 [Neptuniibacter caesariensis]